MTAISKTPAQEDDAPRTGRAVTLAEIARLSDVSEITASRVMRGAGNVSARTVARVEDAARALGYVRNRLAGALAGAPSNQIGVVLPSLSNIVFADVLKGLENRLELDGFHPLLGVSNYDDAREESLVRNLLAWRPAGLVIAEAGMTAATRRMLKESGLPIVEIMDIDRDPIDMQIGMSHRQAGKAMAYYLTGRGHRRIGYIGHEIGGDIRATARLEGFTQALAETGNSLLRSLVLPEPSSVPLGRRATAQMLAEQTEWPDAIFYSNDDMAVGGVFECMAQDIAVPDRIGIAGFNGLEVGQALPVALTTIGSNRVRTGEEAAAQILRRLAGETVVQRLDVGFTLIPGATA